MCSGAVSTEELKYLWNAGLENTTYDRSIELCKLINALYVDAAAQALLATGSLFRKQRMP